MALIVSEFTRKGFVAHIAPTPHVDQSIAIGGASAQSSAFGSFTRFIRVNASADCHVAFGPNPTATTGNLMLTAKVPEYFEIKPGDKIAVIAA